MTDLHCTNKKCTKRTTCKLADEPDVFAMCCKFGTKKNVECRHYEPTEFNLQALAGVEYTPLLGTSKDGS